MSWTIKRKTTNRFLQNKIEISSVWINNWKWWAEYEKKEKRNVTYGGGKITYYILLLWWVSQHRTKFRGFTIFDWWWPQPWRLSKKSRKCQLWPSLTINYCDSQNNSSLCEFGNECVLCWFVCSGLSNNLLTGYLVANSSVMLANCPSFCFCFFSPLGTHENIPVIAGSCSRCSVLRSRGQGDKESGSGRWAHTGLRAIDGSNAREQPSWRNILCERFMKRGTHAHTSVHTPAPTPVRAPACTHAHTHTCSHTCPCTPQDTPHAVHSSKWEKDGRVSQTWGWHQRHAGPSSPLPQGEPGPLGTLPMLHWPQFSLRKMWIMMELAS